MTTASNRVRQELSSVERALRCGPRSFRDLVVGAGGLFPADVLRFLEAQRTNGQVNAETIKSMIAEARVAAPPGDLPQGHGLALPHPLDAEWRFTDATSHALLDSAIAATRPSDLILLIGVPSVALAAASRDDDRRYWVCGEDNIITDGVVSRTLSDRRFRHDRIDGSQAGAAIVDPPWYLPQFQEMLGQASRHSRKGALIFVSTPGEGVRPGILDDLAQLAEVASRAGLDFDGEASGALTYRTPLFEVNALRAAGVGAWLPDWRRGNLAIYRKRSSIATWPIPPKTPSFELTLAGIRIRLLNWDDSSFEELVPVYAGEVFPSVSKRAPRRAEATLWTSGNRAFRAPGQLTLAAMLEIAMCNHVLPKGLERKLSQLRSHCSIDAVERLIQKLSELVDREGAEAAWLLGAAAWERSANDARFLNAS